MLRKIIKIDEEKCDGCGQCVIACAEGALKIIDGKARLVSETYCDGLGACLGECPQSAITIEEREAENFNEDAVKIHLGGGKAEEKAQHTLACGCPGSQVRTFNQIEISSNEPVQGNAVSRLGSWPVQLMLVPPIAPYLKGADLLLCADCVPFAFPDFHERFLKGRIPLVGCPKLDDINFYFEKFKAIFSQARPSSITVLRMEVPCCGSLVQAAIQARNETIPDTPLETYVIGVQGEIISDTVHTGTPNRV